MAGLSHLNSEPRLKKIKNLMKRRVLKVLNIPVVKPHMSTVAHSK